MELGLTIPLQRHLKIKSILYGEENEYNFCWDLHIIKLNNRASLLMVHCSSRYTFTLYDLSWSDWNRLEETFLDGLRKTFHNIGISEKMTADYLQQAEALRLTKTHGRREVAYLTGLGKMFCRLTMRWIVLHMNSRYWIMRSILGFAGVQEMPGWIHQQIG